MAESARRSLVGFALCLFLTVSSFQLVAVGAAPPTHSTTVLKASAVTQANISGYQGVLVNYSSSLSSTFTAFVYLELSNHAGQTVSVNVGTLQFVNGSSTTWVQGFVGIVPPLRTGNYSATVFATTNSSVPISASTTLRLTV